MRKRVAYSVIMLGSCTLFFKVSPFRLTQLQIWMICSSTTRRRPFDDVPLQVELEAFWRSFKKNSWTDWTSSRGPSKKGL